MQITREEVADLISDWITSRSPYSPVAIQFLEKLLLQETDILEIDTSSYKQKVWDFILRTNHID